MRMHCVDCQRHKGFLLEYFEPSLDQLFLLVIDGLPLWLCNQTVQTKNREIQILCD